MISSSYRGAVDRSSVLALGGALLATSVGVLFEGPTVTLLDLVQCAVPLAFALCVVALGVWLWQTDLPGRRIRTVFWWGLLGGATSMVVTGWLLVLEMLAGRVMANPEGILLTGITIGVVAGGLFGVAYDRLTAHRRQFAEQTYRLDEFASVVSHDLRNPLNIAQGHLALARQSGEDLHFDAVERSMNRMERLVREVLALAQQGFDRTTARTVPLDELAQSAWQDLDTADATLRVETDRVVEADIHRLQTLLTNVFHNSVEHGSRPVAGTSAHGGIPVTVTVVEHEDGIAIEDNGPGIPVDEREKVFEGGYSTAGRPGFGLAAVRCIADDHGWEHRFVDPEESDGARFELSGL